ncbi:MAG: hypothetical protein AAGD14_13075 [Planctomycetota bacterium]
MSRRVVIRLSTLAKIAVTTAMIGAAVSLYGRQTGNGAVNAVGSVMLFGGAIVYLIERVRSSRRPRD